MQTSQPFQPFQPYLFANERVLWSGQPRQGLALSTKDALLIPFSFMWGGFAIFWNLMVWLAPLNANSSNSPDWFFKLWGLPFLFIGLYLICGRFFHDAYLRKKLCYAVTDQRIIVSRGTKITSFDIHRLPRLGLSEFRDGTGTLAFDATNNVPWRGINGFGWWVPTLGGSAQFFRIAEPRKIYELIRKQSRP